jgi:PadR family transcriptional regulator PadR
MAHELLGTFEHLVIATALRMKDNAYGAEITREIIRIAEHRTLGAAVYTALDRLEEKGYVESHWGTATSVQGGRAKKFYSVTDEGRAALIKSRRAIDAAWEGLDIGYPPGRGRMPSLGLKRADRETAARKKSDERRTRGR